MNEFDIPLFKKAYDFYKEFYICLKTFPRQDRYSLGQKCEIIILEILKGVIFASQLSKVEKLPILQKTSMKLNLLRVYLRLAKEINVLNNNKYLHLQEKIDEIGRMLGGWIKVTKDRTKNPLRGRGFLVRWDGSSVGRRHEGWSCRPSSDDNC